MTYHVGGRYRTLPVYDNGKGFENTLSLQNKIFEFYVEYEVFHNEYFAFFGDIRVADRDRRIRT